MPRVLIIGYGKMGHIHARHLTQMGVPWDYHDPFVPGGVGLDRLLEYTHAIIATPYPTHYDVFRQLDEFAGRILIEKPVVVRAEHLWVLEDERVFAGMSERFNPAVQALKARVRLEEIVSLEFCRTCRAGDIIDVGIHDLDLFCHLLDLREVPEWRWEGDELVANAGGVEGRFQWPVTEECRRTITVSTVGGWHELDLVTQHLDGESLARAWPVAESWRRLWLGSRAMPSCRTPASRQWQARRFRVANGEEDFRKLTTTNQLRHVRPQIGWTVH